jgi:hypothetical protein
VLKLPPHRAAHEGVIDDPAPIERMAPRTDVFG